MTSSSAVLTVSDLHVAFAVPGAERVEAVKGISFTLHKGRTLALVGESGSGKSVSALSLLKLLPRSAEVSGAALLDGKNLLSLSEQELQRIRGLRVGMIFQEPMTSLNPLHTIERQLSEALYIHSFATGKYLTEKSRRARVCELLDLVGLGALKERLKAYPHELSGGQRQRVMIAMALANTPDVLIADEPTTALDVTIQKQVLDLITELQSNLGVSVLLITHDLTLVRRYAQDVAVMQHGLIVEQGAMERVFATPQHPYTQALLASEPKGAPAPVANATPLLEAAHVSVKFTLEKTFLTGKPKKQLTAVNDISFTLKQGETLGVVGESGSGKSTLALSLLRLLTAEGTITFDGQDITRLDSQALRPLRRHMQMVFQDPYQSLNPRMTVGQVIAEGLLAHGIGSTPPEREKLIADALTEVGLNESAMKRFPHEFSGGQRQRISIARALVLRPRLMILDEPTSALDLTTQSGILALLKDLQQKYGLSYVFISHDLRVIRAISHQVMVLQHGVVVEHGESARLFENPTHAYTKTLLGASFHAA